MKKYRKARKNAFKIELKNELQMRTIHNQYIIKNFQESIRCIQKQKFQNKFNELVGIIPKLFRFLMYCQQNPENAEFRCPEQILDLDVTLGIRKYYNKFPNGLKPMTQ